MVYISNNPSGDRIFHHAYAVFSDRSENLAPQTARFSTARSSTRGSSEKTQSSENVGDAGVCILRVFYSILGFSAVGSLRFYNKLGRYYSVISAFLMLCNGTANPVIYSVYNLDIREEFKSLITCKTPVERRQSLQSISIRNRAIRKRKYKNLELNTSPQPSPMIALRNINNNMKPVTGQQNAAFVFEDTRL